MRVACITTELTVPTRHRHDLEFTRSGRYNLPRKSSCQDLIVRLKSRSSIYKSIYIVLLPACLLSGTLSHLKHNRRANTVNHRSVPPELLAFPTKSEIDSHGELVCIQLCPR